MKKRQLLGIILGCGFMATSAEAVQVYGLYGDGCSQTSGAIVHVDDEIVSVLTFNGEVRQIPTQK